MEAAIPHGACIGIVGVIPDGEALLEVLYKWSDIAHAAFEHHLLFFKSFQMVAVAVHYPSVFEGLRLICSIEGLYAIDQHFFSNLGWYWNMGKDMEMVVHYAIVE